jgi:hypothetical protein
MLLQGIMSPTIRYTLFTQLQFCLHEWQTALEITGKQIFVPFGSDLCTIKTNVYKIDVSCPCYGFRNLESAIHMGMSM